MRFPLLAALLLIPAHIQAAEPVNAPRSGAVKSATKDYQATFTQIETQRQLKTHSAWADADARLEEALKEVMTRADLAEANKITALRKALKAQYAGGISSTTVPAAPDLPKSASARGARTELLAAVQKIDAEYALSVDKAAKSYLDALDVQVKLAMKNGDLEEANRIAAFKKKAEVATRIGSRYPAGPVLLYTFERDTIGVVTNKPVFRDLSGNDNHLVIDRTLTRPGRAGTAVELGDNRPLAQSLRNVGIVDSSPRTVAFWAYFEAPPQGKWKHFIGWGGKTARKKGFFVSAFEGNYLLWSFGFDNDWRLGKPYETKAWRHHALVYDGKTIHWYLDGVDLAKPFNIQYDTEDGPLLVGDADLFLDELVIYDRALTEEELKMLRNR